jgi:transcriptional regulator with XRE-family HTH domain
MVKFDCQMATHREFSNWLIEQLDKREWTQADLSKRSGVTTSQISRILSGTRGIGIDACRAIARAFHIPEERVFRKAGFLPNRPCIIGEQKGELDDYYEALSQDNRDRLVAIAKTLHEQQESYDVGED